MTIPLYASTFLLKQSMCKKINIRCNYRLINKALSEEYIFCRRLFSHLRRCLHHCFVVHINLHINLYIPFSVESTTHCNPLQCFDILSDYMFLNSLIQVCHCKQKMFATMEVNNWMEITQNALVNPAIKEAIAVK